MSFETISSFAQPTFSSEIAEVLTGTRLTALAKPDGGVRGIGVDGIGVYDHTLAPQVVDDDGERYVVTQPEGGEQRDL